MTGPQMLSASARDSRAAGCPDSTVRASGFGVGSVLWLLRHDLRLAGRGMRNAGARKSRVTLAILGTTVLVLHATGFACASGFAALHERLRTDLMPAALLALAAAFMLFLSKAVSEATDSLYRRGDLDLLLSSPLPMRRVLTTRLLAIALVAGFMPIMLVLPMVNGMMLHGDFTWIGVYPLVISLSLTAAAAGAAITFGLSAWVGPRWTPLVARGLATLFGAFSFLFAQSRFLLPDAVWAGLWQGIARMPGSGSEAFLWLPARALLGEALPEVTMLALGIGALLAVSAAMGTAYGSGVTSTLAVARRIRRAEVTGRFRSGPFAALLTKEMLVLLRQPGLGVQIFYQFVFLVPGVIALVRLGEAEGAHSPSGAVFLTAMMTGRITKIIAAGPFEADRAAALTATAPVSAGQAVAAKLAATGVILSLVIGASLVGVWMQIASALPAACVASAAAAATRLRTSMGRSRSTQRAGLQGWLPSHADGLLGIMTDIGWGIFGALATLVI